MRQSVIAVIDDDLDLLLALDDMLISLDYRTELYSSAEQFLKTARRSRATCLLIDVKLCDISGIELARQLRADGFTFPLIFMSGEVDEMVLRQAADLKSAAFLLKPFSTRRLADAVAKAMAVHSENGA